jgi:hypothetical protein
MSSRLAGLYVAVACLLFASPLLRAEGEGEGGKGAGAGEHKKGDRPGPMGGGMIKFVLDHAEDLKLTEEQKTKIQDLLKNAKAPGKPDGAKPGEGGAPPAEEKRPNPRAELEKILAKEQLDKLKELQKAAHDKKEGGPRKDGEKKEGEKKEGEKKGDPNGGGMEK